MSRSADIEKAIRSADGPALCAYLMAGYPSVESFPDILARVAEVADVVEVGVPFTDPIADGRTIQEAGFSALGSGVTLSSIFDLLEEVGPGLAAPYLLMGYYNPFLAGGLDRLAERLEKSGVSGLIVPDLTPEESGAMDEVVSSDGVALVRLVTPATPLERMRVLGESTSGFLYAVTTTGITGGDLALPADLLAYLDRARESTSRPLMAGFGVRSRSQVEALADHVDGVIIGSALVEAITTGSDPAEFLAGLRP